MTLIWAFYRGYKYHLKQEQILDLNLYLMFGAFLGGRLFHVFYEYPNYYRLHPLEVLKIWQGGFVFYGALIGAVSFALFWCKKNRQQPLIWGDFLVPFAGLNYALGRLGCFFTGCCYGRQCHLPWAVTFHSHKEWGIPIVPRHPTQIYAFLWEFIVLIGLLLWEKRKSPSHKSPGLLFFVWLGLHALGRLFMESFRDDDRGAFILNQSVSFWISVILIFLSFFISLSLKIGLIKMNRPSDKVTGA
ncbi:MAG: prolipoprotein diacylglyceryl transferase [Bdellovibrionales bacterium]|nr:prolipoprotein diacylglyceryl transferase [Bdellovibrionales bacterium]